MSLFAHQVNCRVQKTVCNLKHFAHPTLASFYTLHALFKASNIRNCTEFSHLPGLSCRYFTKMADTCVLVLLLMQVASQLTEYLWALPSVVTAKMFEWLYHPAGGLVNFAAGRPRDQLARRSGPGPAVADPGRRVARDALRGPALLRAAPRRSRPSSTRPPRWTAPRLAGLRPHHAGRSCGRSSSSTLLFRTLDALRAFDIMFVLTGGRPGGHHRDADRLRLSRACSRRCSSASAPPSAWWSSRS